MQQHLLYKLEHVNNTQTQMVRWLESGTVLGKGKNDKLGGALLSAPNKSRTGASKQERQRMHKGNLQLTILKFQRSIAETQKPTVEENCSKDTRLQHHWALRSQWKNYKNSSCLSLLKILVVLSGPAAESACTRGGSHSFSRV